MGMGWRATLVAMTLACAGCAAIAGIDDPNARVDDGGTAEAVASEGGVTSDGSVTVGDASHEGNDAGDGTVPVDGMTDSGADVSLPSDSGPADAGITIPAGWTLVEVALTPSGTAPPTCGIDWSVSLGSLQDGLNASPAQCGCSCGTLTAACSVTLTSDSDTVPGPGCVEGSAPVVQLDAGTCMLTGPGQVLTYFHNAVHPTATASSCLPTPSVSTPSVTWTRVATACSPSDPSGPTPPTDTSFSSCIASQGDNACPAGTPFINRLVEYGGVTDTRGCAACTCTPPAQVSCDGTIDSFLNGNCTSSPEGQWSTAQLNTCMGANVGSSVQYTATAPSGSSCTASTPTSTGTAAPDNPMTFCCAP